MWRDILLSHVPKFVFTELTPMPIQSISRNVNGCVVCLSPPSENGTESWRLLVKECNALKLRIPFFKTDLGFEKVFFVLFWGFVLLNQPTVHSGRFRERLKKSIKK